MYESCLAEVRKVGEKLALYGYPGADDKELYGWQGCILDRLLSIQDGRPVGHRQETLWQVVHAATLEKLDEKVVWHTFYLWALKAYPPVWKPEHREHIDRWRKRVWSDLRKCAQEGRTSAYLRDRRFDPLIGLLFPEMQQYLQTPLPGEHSSPTVPPASRRANITRANGETHPTPSDGNGLWLSGSALEQWRRQNPEAAKAWDESRRR